MGKKLAIKGHPTRGKEVIKLLEMMGGHNGSNLLGNKSDYAYFITDSADCPFGSYLYSKEYVCSIPRTIDIDCGEYDLSTMMVTVKMEE